MSTAPNRKNQSVLSEEEYTAASKSPVTFETPNNADSKPTNRKSGYQIIKHNAGEKIQLIANKYNLDSFLKTHTSEDNESFQNIVNIKRDESGTKVEKCMYESSLLEKDKILSIKEKQINYVEYYDNDASSGVLNVCDAVQLSPSNKIATSDQNIKIIHNNTRFSKKSCNMNDIIPISNFVDIQPKKCISSATGNTAKKIINCLQINNFLSTPSTSPGGAYTPIMTWGKVEGTPLKLENMDTTISKQSFRIHKASRREEIALQLVEKAAERMRGRQRQADLNKKSIFSPYLQMSTGRLATLSPAAKRLASEKLGLRSPDMTPSSRKCRLYTAFPQRLTPYLKPAKRDLHTEITERCSEASNHSNLTDDLLKIPHPRKKAHEFFKDL